MRAIHGWVRLGSDCIILGLDSYQFHLYHVMRALAVPTSSQEDPRGLCDVSDSQLALVTKCSRFTIARIKKELLTMGLLAKQGGQYFVLDPPIETLHNHKVVLKEIANFLRTIGGTHAPLNAARRRTGHRKAAFMLPPLTPDVAPVDTPCSPQQHPMLPPLTPDVAPVDTFLICLDTGEAKKLISKEDKKSTATSRSRPHKDLGDPRVQSTLEAMAKELGYPIPSYPRCASEVKRGLKLGYTEEEILGCWRTMRQFESRKGKWLPLVAVIENLGEFVAGHLKESKPWGRATRVEAHSDPKDFEGRW